jgi:hypothetical protein
VVKTCCRCRQEKPLSEFNKRTGSKDGYQGCCRPCTSAYYRGNSDKHKANVAARNKAISEANSRKVWEYLAEHPCVDCNESDPIVLEFDHVRGIKHKAICQLISYHVSWERILEEIAKCDVRCANCHRRRTAKQLGWYAWNQAPVAQLESALVF